MASWFQTFGDRALILGRRPRLRLAFQLLAFAVLTGSLVYAVRDSWSDAEELLRTETTAVAFFNAKIERYPAYLGRLVLWVSASSLYGVREHPEGNPAQIILNSWL